MSAANITVTKLSFNTFETLPSYTACAADSSIGSSYYAKVPISSDERLLIMLQNSNSSAAKTVSIIKGLSLIHILIGRSLNQRVIIIYSVEHYTIYYFSYFAHFIFTFS